MFEVFVALFGGIFYSSRYINDKKSRVAASKQTEEVSKSHIDSMNSWKSKVVDMQLEMELRGLVRNAFISDVKNALANIGWKGKVAIRLERDQEDVVRLLMASKGKLIRKDAELGVPSGVYGLPDTSEQVQRNLESYDMVQFIDQWLRKHGIHEKMYIERAGVYNPLNDNSAHIGGRYVWQPMLRLHPSIVEVPPMVRVNRNTQYHTLADMMKSKSNYSNI